MNENRSKSTGFHRMTVLLAAIVHGKQREFVALLKGNGVSDSSKGLISESGRSRYEGVVSGGGQRGER